MPTPGFTGIDKVQIIDGNGTPRVDILLDIEKEPLPFDDDSVSAIAANNVLEHLSDLRFVINECWRVLKVGHFITGDVPIAGSDTHWQDPTHVRGFIKKTFSYFTGVNEAFPSQPSHPRYANYGFKPWNEIEIRTEGDIIFFKLSPRKDFI